MRKTNLGFMGGAFALSLAAAFLVIPSANASRAAASSNVSARQAGSRHDLTDANIAAIVTVADNLDIDYGKIALSKTKNKMVREFARLMVTDHSAVQKAVGDLAGKLSLTPVEDDMSRGLAAGGVDVKAKLNSLDGKAFDKYYIDNEVKYHELVVNATKNVLITHAQNAELKAALVRTLPLFEAHLEHARMVQKAFNKGKSKAKTSKHSH